MGAILDQFRSSLMFRWDVGTLGWVVWDGSLTAGVLTIGAVTQGTSPWVVRTTAGLSPASPTAATVGVASAQAVAPNSGRRGLVLTNTSTNTISLGFGVAAVLNSGVTLYPGGVYEMDEPIFATGAVQAIAGGAASNLAIQEYS